MELHGPLSLTLCDVPNVDTFCDGLLIVIFVLAVLLFVAFAVDVASQFHLKPSYLALSTSFPSSRHMHTMCCP